MREEKFGFDDFLSPFSWRYGSASMRRLFSEVEKRTTWRKVWLALAEAEAEAGLLSRSELNDIRTYADAKHVDIGSAHELERLLRHDLMAELRTFASQARAGGGKLHLGATSMDIEDNADVMIYAKAVEMLLSRLAGCLAAARVNIIRYRRMVCVAWTHLQPAEPTTLGYRLAGYALDLVMDVKLLEILRAEFLLGKGVKGAVGTSASYKALLGSDRKVKSLEMHVMERLGVDSFEVTSQTYPRKVDFLILSVLASIAQSCHKFGLDLRVMQSPTFGELSEPIGKKQVGSSAMPFKRNPVSAERMCSLARFVSVLPSVGFMNAANSILERTLDDSASRRIVIPEAFLAVDECLTVWEGLMAGLQVHPAMIRRNLERYGPFAGTEALLMKLVERGGNRQELHERIRMRSFEAWEEVMKGNPNPLEKILSRDRAILAKLTRREIIELLDATNYVGDAVGRCDSFVRKEIDPILARHREKPRGGLPEY
jgi:adenylosuccinate lyase